MDTAKTFRQPNSLGCVSSMQLVTGHCWQPRKGNEGLLSFAIVINIVFSTVWQLWFYGRSWIAVQHAACGREKPMEVARGTVVSCDPEILYVVVFAMTSAPVRLASAEVTPGRASSRSVRSWSKSGSMPAQSQALRC
eukprot:6477013-Amphidinium_carterae.1